MNIEKHTCGGYSLVEVMISVSVLLIATIGPMTIAAQGIKSAAFSLEQNTAFFIAQEGIEAMVALRNEAVLNEIENSGDSWAWFDALYAGGGVCNGVSGACSFGIDFRDDTISNNYSTNTCGAGNEGNCLLYLNETNNRAVYSHDASGASGPSAFTRIITVEEITPDVVADVTVQVTWSSHVFGGTTQSVELTTQLFNTL